MRLVSWNVAGRVGRAAEQARVLAAREPDVIALQEVRERSAPLLIDGLADGGLCHHVSAGPAPHGRRYFEVVCSRWPVTRLPEYAEGLPFPERLLSTLVEAPFDLVEVHTTHVPPGSNNGWRKIEHLNALRRFLGHPETRLRLLCGDFNTPRAERPDGTVITWAQDERTGAFLKRPPGATARDDSRPWDPDAWDAGERGVLEGLAEHGLPDAYRALYPGREEFSYYARGKDRMIGRRFDHVFASPEMRPATACYLNDLREAGLSDHAAIEVDFDPGSAR